MINRATLSELAFALSGLPVYGCLPDSPAARAGVRYGDILLSVDGHATPSWDAYVAARQHSGASIRVRLFRDGAEFDLDIALTKERNADARSIAAALGLFADGADEPRGTTQ